MENDTSTPPDGPLSAAELRRMADAGVLRYLLRMRQPSGTQS